MFSICKGQGRSSVAEQRRGRVRRGGVLSGMLAALLAGCGGGGGLSAPPAVPGGLVVQQEALVVGEQHTVEPFPFVQRLLDAETASRLRATGRAGSLAAELATAYSLHRARLVAALQPWSSALSEDELALIFAADVACELRSASLLVVPGGGAADYRREKLLDFDRWPYASHGLLCDQYVGLAVQLFYLLKPASDLQVLPVGVGRTCAFDNHSFLAAAPSPGRAGRPLIIDPTYSTVYFISLGEALARVPLPVDGWRQLARRDFSPLSQGIGGDVLATFQQGSWDYRSLLKLYQGSATAYTAADYLGGIVAVPPTPGLAPRETWLVRTTQAEEAWYLDAAGSFARLPVPSVLEAAPYVAGTDSGVCLLQRDGRVQRWRPDGTVSLVTEGATQIVAGPGGTSVWIRKLDGSLLSYQGSLTTLAAAGVVRVASQGQDVVALDADGALTRHGAQVVPLASGVHTLTAGSPPRLHFELQGGVPVPRVEQDGFVVYRDGRGAEQGDLWEVDPTGASRKVLGEVSELKLGLRHTSVNALVQGVPYRYSFPVPGVPLERFLPLGNEQAGNPSPIQPTLWSALRSGAPGLPQGTLLRALGGLHGDYYLTAQDQAGVVYLTPSGLF